MNDTPQNNEKSQKLPGSEPSKDSEDVFADINGDDIFTIKVSENMEIRNILRSGIVDTQGKDTDKIPLFVSWPNWLEDGIVCMFAKDLHEVLHKAVKDTVLSLNTLLGVEGLDIESDVSTEKQDYEVEKIQESPGDKKPVEEEQKAGRDETETGIEQEITEDLKEVDTHQVENEEKPEEPYSSIPDKYSTE